VAMLKDYPVGYRRRVGACRILFDLDKATRSVRVQEIERRTSTTYKKRRRQTEGEPMRSPDAPRRKLLRATERMHPTARGYHRCCASRAPSPTSTALSRSASLPPLRGDAAEGEGFGDVGATDLGGAVAVRPVRRSYRSPS
jgi:hypothetical protein